MSLLLDEDNVQCARRIVDSERSSQFFKNRYARNVANPPTQFSRDEFWKEMISCLCTSMQRASPNTPVGRLGFEKPFPLSLQICCSAASVDDLVRDVLSKRRLRFTSRIAKFAAENLGWLNGDGGWTVMESRFAALKESSNHGTEEERIQIERDAAELVRNKLDGFGPKQSRNLWQNVGITKYVIPLDSRFTNWLRRLPVALPKDYGLGSKSVFQDEKRYRKIEDYILGLCSRAGVYPCLLDAAVFANKDTEEWPES